jgi:hypothetical protein
VPQELRTLSFSKNEVFHALQNYCTQTGTELRDESRKALTLEPSGKVAIEQSGKNLHFTQAEVAAALIMFCAQNSIPVARRSTKSLEVIGESLALRLTIS